LNLGEVYLVAYSIGLLALALSEFKATRRAEQEAIAEPE